ncbi:MAG: deoxynucleoside kinase [bacterium]|nr:deoxynucleoside kinase [bacterium]
MSGKHIFVGLLGLTGSGKSTLAELLKRSGFLHLEEPFVANPFLPEYYASGMKEKAFQSQLFFLLRKWALTMAAGRLLEYFPVAIDPSMDLDVYMYVEALRKMGSLSVAEYDLYHLAVEALMNGLPKTDFLIYCRVAPGTAMARIKGRGREMEKCITEEYLALQMACLEKWLGQASVPSLVLDFDTLNANTEEGASGIVEEVEKTLRLIRSK